MQAVIICIKNLPMEKKNDLVDNVKKSVKLKME